MSAKSSLIKEQLIGASSLLSHPGQTPCSSVWTLVQAHVHRNYDAASCGEKACEIPLWLTKPQCTQVKLNKHPHHNFLSSPCV